MTPNTTSAGRARLGLRLVAMLLVASLVAAACGGGGGDDETTNTTLTTEATPTTSATADADAVDESTETTEAPTTSVVAETTEPVVADVLAPLTGLTIDEAIADRPALAAKIDNISLARPQAGINQADVVYEERVEGGLTRLLAVYQSQDAPVLGPIRSARSTDVPLLTPLRQPLFAWSGANAAFAQLIRSVAIRDVGFEAEAAQYTRASDRRSPSNLMTSTVDLWALVDETGAPPMILDHLLPGGSFDAGEPAVGVDVSYRGTQVSHVWDEELGGWARTQNGTAHVDADGVQIAPANVIVQFVDYEASGQVDSTGAEVPEAVLEGQGVAWIFSNGRVVEGTWSKSNVTEPIQYRGPDGAPVALTPGATWVLLPEPGEATLR